MEVKEKKSLLTRLGQFETRSVYYSEELSNALSGVKEGATVVQPAERHCQGWELKVKVTLERALKAQTGNRGIAVLFF